MSEITVLQAMRQNKSYLPEQVPVDLSTQTRASYLRSLWRGGLVDRTREGRRFVYQTKQKELSLGVD